MTDNTIFFNNTEFFVDFKDALALTFNAASSTKYYASASQKHYASVHFGKIVIYYSETSFQTYVPAVGWHGVRDVFATATFTLNEDEKVYLEWKEGNEDRLISFRKE
ncbi:hypothetical protein FRC14_005425 [Serendipita sp. 396]|nr:hypothetical protein FRC14_005425 [Serendipita sp. 396]KAG8778520.1 hypothetical protein FRC15_010747 [Serendipita sp. 397]KAG8826018.1 hypothetical protein FRC19_009960 [Serendipita sp. 401]KAG8865969.1 hypothetical protein FRC20_009220 [Serendipita sp. 405]KAG9056791.1 hypothetical protein FS842_009604 [Serendipita sp. 407]